MSMKNPFSSTTTLSTRGLLILTLLLLFFVISTSTGAPDSASLETSSRNHHQSHSCGSFPHKSSSRSWCIRFQRMNERRHLGIRFPPPPPIEIDPIYGVEKRLVPSGPNPLHN
ncbi:hypothetical protein OIU76_013558 [Salix suchowensis]|uniref:Uncharacterized protein n=1 Tax=Salix suchowensis TaxID=1278906 RepID=A0ABQ9A3L5_9ROSI|nr:hypothetical protein OIU76_013558 [Salix suchowensis]KAJ6322349.1 hypothetical protein OIU77_012253 [Salix suchowensis]KAJ6350634.1 hypothetical protein OIU78_006724 [Salix suchowensis]